MEREERWRERERERERERRGGRHMGGKRVSSKVFKQHQNIVEMCAHIAITNMCVEKHHGIYI